MTDAPDNGEMPLITTIVKYNMKYRKADITGRITGGVFTNYASTAGRFGSKRLSKNAKRVRAVTNLGIASYGAVIKAISQGHRSVEAIVQSVLTGDPEHVPSAGYNDVSITEDHGLVEENLRLALSEVVALTQVAPEPVPIKEFCSRPQNVNLKGVCR